MQDLRARQEAPGDAPRYSNLHKHQQQAVHGNRKALFWCESRHFEATHVIPHLLTSSSHHMHTALTADPQLALRSTEAERLGAVGGMNCDGSGGVVPMQGLRKRKACDKSNNGKQARTAGQDSRHAADTSNEACMDGMRGDAGEVWVNAFVVGTGSNREV